MMKKKDSFQVCLNKYYEDFQQGSKELHKNINQSKLSLRKKMNTHSSQVYFFEWEG